MATPDKIKEFHEILNNSDEFKGIYKDENQLRGILSDDTKSQEFFNILQESKEFKGVFSDRDHLLESTGIEKKNPLQKESGKPTSGQSVLRSTSTSTKPKTWDQIDLPNSGIPEPSPLKQKVVKSLNDFNDKYGTVYTEEEIQGKETTPEQKAGQILRQAAKKQADGQAVPKLADVLAKKGERNLQYIEASKVGEDEIQSMVKSELEAFQKSPEYQQKLQLKQQEASAALEQKKVELQGAVSQGKITADLANAELQTMNQNITKKINDEMGLDWKNHFETKVKPTLNSSIAAETEKRFFKEVAKNQVLSKRAKWTIENIANKDEFREMSFPEKKKVIASTWELTKSALKKKGYKEDFIQRYKEEFMGEFVTQASNKKGQPTSYSIREWAEQSLAEIDEREKELLATPKVKQSEFIPSLGGGVSPASTFYDVNDLPAEVKQELGDLAKAKEKINEVVAMPEQSAGTLFEGIKYGFVEGKNYPLPMMKTMIDLSNSLSLYRAAEKAKQGKALTEGEKFMLHATGMETSYNQDVETSFGFTAGSGATASIPYMVDMAMGGWAAAPARTAVKEGILKLVPKLAESVIYKQGVARPISVIVGEMARTAADPAKWANNYFKHMSPEIRFALGEEAGDKITNVSIGDMVAILDSNRNVIDPYTGKETEELTGKGMAPMEAFAYGFLDTFKENLSEQLGGAFDGVGSKMVQSLAKNNEWAKRLYIGYMLKMNGGMTPGSFAKTMAQLRKGISEQAGLNGYLGENMEEYGSAIAEDFMYNRKLGQSFTPEFFKETAAVTGLIQLPMYALGLGAKGIDRIVNKNQAESKLYMRDMNDNIIPVNIPIGPLAMAARAVRMGKVAAVDYLNSELGKTPLSPEQRLAVSQYVQSQMYWNEIGTQSNEMFGVSYDALRSADKRQAVRDKAFSALQPFLKTKDQQLLDQLIKKQRDAIPVEDAEIIDEEGNPINQPQEEPVTEPASETAPNTEQPQDVPGSQEPIQPPVVNGQLQLPPMTTEEEEVFDKNEERLYSILDNIVTGLPLTKEDHDVIQGNLEWFDSKGIEVPEYIAPEDQEAYNSLSDLEKQAYSNTDEAGKQEIIAQAKAKLNPEPEVIAAAPKRLLEQEYPESTREFMNSLRDEFFSSKKIGEADYNDLSDEEKDKMDKAFSKFIDKKMELEVEKEEEEVETKTKTKIDFEPRNETDNLAQDLSGERIALNSLIEIVGKKMIEIGKKGNPYAINWGKKDSRRQISDIAYDLLNNPKSIFYKENFDTGDALKLVDAIADFIVDNPGGVRAYINQRKIEIEKENQRIKEEFGDIDFSKIDAFVSALTEEEAERVYEGLTAVYGDDLERLREDLEQWENDQNPFSSLGLLFNNYLPGVDIGAAFKGVREIYDKEKANRQGKAAQPPKKGDGKQGDGKQPSKKPKSAPKIGKSIDIDLDTEDLDFLQEMDLFGGSEPRKSKSDFRKDYESMFKAAQKELREADADLRAIRARAKQQGIEGKTLDQILRPKVVRYEQALIQFELIRKQEKNVRSGEDSQQTLFDAAPKMVQKVYDKKLTEEQINKGGQILDKFFERGVYDFATIAGTIQEKINDEEKFENILASLVALYGQKYTQVEDDIADQMDDRKGVRKVVQDYFTAKEEDVPLTDEGNNTEEIDSQDQKGSENKDNEVATKEEFEDAALKLTTLDLEDDQVVYPNLNGKKLTDIGGGKDYNLSLIEREALPESGPFEISIENNEGEEIGFIRGSKSNNTISFNLIHIKQDYRGKGIGTDIYEKFLNDGYTIKSDKEITDSTYSLYTNLANTNNYDRIVFSDGRVGLVKPKNQKNVATDVIKVKNVTTTFSRLKEGDSFVIVKSKLSEETSWDKIPVAVKRGDGYRVGKSAGTIEPSDLVILESNLDKSISPNLTFMYSSVSVMTAGWNSNSIARDLPKIIQDKYWKASSDVADLWNIGDTFEIGSAKYEVVRKGIDNGRTTVTVMTIVAPVNYYGFSNAEKEGDVKEDAAIPTPKEKEPQEEVEKKEYRYQLTQRPLGIGTYPNTPTLIRLEDGEPGNIRNYGYAVYSERLSPEKWRSYELLPIDEIEEIEASTYRSEYYNKITAKRYRGNPNVLEVTLDEPVNETEDFEPDVISLTVSDFYKNLENKYFIKNDTKNNEPAGELPVEDQMGPEDVSPNTGGNQPGGGQNVAGNDGQGNPLPGDNSGNGNVSPTSGVPGDTNVSGGQPGDGGLSASGGNRGGGTGSGSTGRSSNGGAPTNVQGNTRNPIGEGTDLSFDQKLDLQKKAESVPALYGNEEGEYNEEAHIRNIDENLPISLDSQKEDVMKAEKSLFVDNKKAVLFTNGTGTGKTSTALGIVKRAVKNGKRVLILTPKQSINDNFINEGKWLQLDVYRLESKTDIGYGNNLTNGPITPKVIVTSFANFGDNIDLQRENFDLIVVDEADQIMSSMEGNETLALSGLKIVANHRSEAREKAYETIIGFKYTALRDEEFGIRKEMSALERMLTLLQNLQAKRGELGSTPNVNVQELMDIDSKIADMQTKGEMEARIAEFQTRLYEVRSEKYQLIEDTNISKELLNNEIQDQKMKKRVVFMSATPFASAKATDYAEDFLFEYPKDQYGQPDFNQFMIDRFGYRIRYSKLTAPDAGVNVGALERQFHEDLKTDGVLFSRQLASEFDYSRTFFLLKDPMGEEGIGKMIDKGVNLMKSEEYKLGPVVAKKMDYLYKMRLLEAYKAKIMIPVIREAIDKGYKIVIFHNYNQGAPSHPFVYTYEDLMLAAKGDQAQYQFYKNQLAKFEADHPEFMELDMSGLINPGETLMEAFPEESVLFRGGMTDKKKKEAIQDFNTGSKKLFIVNKEAGKAGISLHDVTGEYKRLLFNLGLPVRPNDAIQSEGRIYRVGNRSDAAFLYPVIHTDFELGVFSDKTGPRSATAENFALGNQARDLKTAFTEGYIDAVGDIGWGELGQGGKAADRTIDVSPFDLSINHYNMRGKRDRNSPFEGVDFFPTPEPLGFKMVEWLHVRAGMKVLEPSAGKGSIARYIPDYANPTIIEPLERSLMTAAMYMQNKEDLTSLNEKFEDLHSANKYDRIVMNPPFGTAGKMAVDHILKAFNIHLRDYGRLIAIMPTSPRAIDRMNNFLYGEEANQEAVLRAVYSLPDVTFSKAGTKVNCFVIVIDKFKDEEVRNQVRTMGGSNFNAPNTMLKNVGSINEMFEQLRDMDGPSIIEPKEVPQTDSPQTAPTVEPDLKAEVVKNYHDKKKRDNWVVTLNKRTDAPTYQTLNSKAKQTGQGYSSFKGKGAIPGFQFDKESAANDFAAWVNSGNGEEPKLMAEKVIKTKGDKLVLLNNVVDAVNSQIAKQKINGKLFTEKESEEYTKYIESNYEEGVFDFSSRSKDIRRNIFTYWDPLMETNINGINVRVAEGITTRGVDKWIRSYLIYADGKIVGLFDSKESAYNVIDFIKSNLVKKLSEQNSSQVVDYELTPNEVAFRDTLTDVLADNFKDIVNEVVVSPSEDWGLPIGSKLQVDAYHGSPYLFDKFTTNKIGTGEGAQAFGWGLYFTDLKGIAQTYAKKLSPVKSGYVYNGTLRIAYNEWGDTEEFDNPVFDKNYNLIAADNFDVLRMNNGKSFKAKDIRVNDDGITYDIGTFLSVKNVKGIDRTLYKVSLHKGKTPSEYNWLEWDNQVSSDNIIRINKSLEKRGIPASPKPNMEIGFEGRVTGGMKGKEVYFELVKIFGDEYKVQWGKQASLFLLENGIDGIKYPAESLARGATSSTARGFNYVVFDENAVSIEDIILFQKGGEGQIMGAFYGNKVFIDPRVARPQTPIHEFGHAFIKALKTKSPEIVSRGFELMNGTDYLADVQSSPAYRNDTLESQQEEALVRAISDRGVQILDPKKKSSFLQWLRDFWNEIKSMVGFTGVTPKEVSEMTLDEYLNRAVGTMFNKSELDGLIPNNIGEDTEQAKMQWEKNFPNILQQTNISTLTNHPDYAKAKAGDTKSAAKVVADVVKPKKIRQIVQGNKTAMIVPVLAKESSGNNKLPLAYAALIAIEGGNRVSKIIQTNKTYHTGSNAMHRLMNNPTFSGNVVNGRDYVIIEDVVTSGSTVRALKDYIENKGGRVTLVTSLATARYSSKLAISQDTISKIKEKFNTKSLNTLLSQYGIADKYTDLTNSQGRYLLSFSTIDSIRDSINDYGLRIVSNRTGYNTRRPVSKVNEINEQYTPYEVAKYELMKAWRDQDMPLGITPQAPKDPLGINLFAKAVKFAYEAIKLGAKNVGQMLKGTGFKISDYWRKVFDAASKPRTTSSEKATTLDFLSNEDTSGLIYLMNQLRMMNPKNKEDLVASLDALKSISNIIPDNVITAIDSLKMMAETHDFPIVKDFIDNLSEEAAPKLALDRNGNLELVFNEKRQQLDIDKAFALAQEVKQVLNDLGIKVSEKRKIRGALGRFFTLNKKVEVLSLMEMYTAIHEAMHFVDDKHGLYDKVMATRGSNPVKADLEKIYLDYYAGAKAEHPTKLKMIEGMAVLMNEYLYDPVKTKLDYPHAVAAFLTPGGIYNNSDINTLMDRMQDILGKVRRLNLPLRLQLRMANWKAIIKEPGFLSQYTWKNVSPAHVGMWRWLKFQKNQTAFTKELDNLAGIAYQDTSTDVAFFHAMRANSISSAWLNGDQPAAIYQRGGKYRYSKANVAEIGRLVEVAGKAAGLDKEDAYRAFESYLIARRMQADFNRMVDAKNTLDAYIASIGDEAPTPIQIAIVARLNAQYEAYKSIVENDQQDIAAIQATIQVYADTFELATNMFTEVNRNLLEFSRNTGLISEDNYAEWVKNDDYASFQRVIFDDIANQGPSQSSGGASVSKPSQFKTRKGNATRTFMGPYTAMIMQVPQTINRGYQNLWWQNFGNYVKRFGKQVSISKKETQAGTKEDVKLEFDFMYLPKQGRMIDGKPDLSHLERMVANGEAISFFINGKKVYYKTAPWIQAMASTMIPEVNAEFLENVMKMGADVFAQMTTSASIPFALQNLAVDQISTLFTTKTGKVTPIVDEVYEFAKEYKAILRVLAKTVGIDNLDEKDMARLEKFLALGGSRLTLYSSFENQTIGDIISKVRPDMNAKIAAKKIGGKIMDTLSIPVNSTEIATRFGEFSRALNQGDSEDLAMYKAAQVSVPWHEKGLYGGKIGRTSVRSVAYAAASIRATEKLLKAGYQNLQRTFIVGGILTAASAATMAYGFMAASDDDRAAILSVNAEEFGKYVFYYDGEEWGRIRMPEPFSTIFGTAQMVALAYVNYHWRQKPNTYTTEEWFRPLLSSLPFGEKQVAGLTEAAIKRDKDILLKTIYETTPTIAQASFMAGTGSKFFPTVMPIVPQYLADKPAEQQFNKRTSEFSKFVGQKLGVSPMVSDAFLAQQFGSNARFLLQSFSDDPKPFLKAPWKYGNEKAWLRGREYNQFMENLTAFNQEKNGLLGKMEMAYGLDKSEMQAIFNERKVTPSDFKDRADIIELRKANPEAAKYVEEFYKQYFVAQAVNEITRETAKLNELTDDISADYKLSFFDMLYDFNNSPSIDPQVAANIKRTGEDLADKLQDKIDEIGKPYYNELQLMDKNPQAKYLYLELKESKRNLNKALRKIQ